MKDKIRELPAVLLDHIKNQVENIEFGSITIQLQGSSGKIDVITELRERFLEE